MPSIIATPDGANICARDWTPVGEAWLRLVLVHGAAEHAGRYEAVGRRLAQAGVDVRAYDQRGHGASSGRRGDVRHWSDYTGDVGRMVQAQRSPADGLPIALLGHSMGGLIALDAVLTGAASPDLLVLSAPAISDGLPAWQHALVPLVVKVWPTLSLANAWGPEDLSRDPAVGEAAAADPLHLKRLTVRLGALGFGAQERVKAALDDLEIPTCVVQGGQDTLVPPAATEVFDRLPGVTRKLYPALRHETLFEPEGPEVVDDIIGWLREAVAQLG